MSASIFSRVFTSTTTIIRALCTLHISHTYIYEFTETKGESMIPTLSASNDYVHVSKRCRDGDHCEMGDVIVAVKPTDPNHRICKRITGMPGDFIRIDPSSDECDYIQVPKGHVWITGDNLSHSLDSRSYNALPMALIKGKVIAANDFNQSLWKKSEKYGYFGFRKITNNYINE
ncbi:endopeptidase catalytic subunit IMP1 NDAI_0H03070 [Naumovozyma dairenensis CBS 421]|uniref:Peptidase S26 domain-containing protein n=1 Tax=Naumovozyma dairenensis (strain ATCC 10597 / BCRC 20456 / CBS 421 / NBRC 0211 / NRRL Y-12639) TaxID=1071378 RepID=G0WFB9_NAUDC|nr:hypothetical protein NDAI_0H03070 [Naumovozyma dairenensis CBS 421]CCD26480.1 hypothetical protein NDAI_0H03070 [Naumovozyma dairenensis CBS 421]